MQSDTIPKRTPGIYGSTLKYFSLYPVIKISHDTILLIFYRESLPTKTNIKGKEQEKQELIQSILTILATRANNNNIEIKYVMRLWDLTCGDFKRVVYFIIYSFFSLEWIDIFSLFCFLFSFPFCGIIYFSTQSFFYI